MEKPVEEIADVIKTLCTSKHDEQLACISRYFTRNAEFIHPFCRTPNSAVDSLWAIKQIYAWYKILSPKIDVAVNSVAFDQANLILYVSIQQTFRIWIIPGYVARPSLVTKLQLTHDHGPLYDNNSYAAAVKRDADVVNDARLYYIKSQNDLYQTDEFIKFIAPWGIGSLLVNLWQVFATLMCIVGAMLLFPVTSVYEKYVRKA